MLAGDHNRLRFFAPTGFIDHFKFLRLSMDSIVGAIIDRPRMDLRTNLKIRTIFFAFPSGEGGGVADG